MFEYLELKFEPEDTDEDFDEFDLIEEVVQGDRAYLKAFNGMPFKRGI